MLSSRMKRFNRRNGHGCTPSRLCHMKALEFVVNVR
jgi:hypothetical protein